MAISVIDLASNIWKGELQEDSSTSSVSIMYWLRANIGTLNNLLGTDYKINKSTLEPNNDGGCILGTEEASIFKYVYLMNYFERQFKLFTGVGGVSLVDQISSDGGVVRMVDRTKISSQYLQLRKDTESTLGKLVNKYKFRNQGAQQVTGDDIYISARSYNYREQGVPYQDEI